MGVGVGGVRFGGGRPTSERDGLRPGGGELIEEVVIACEVCGGATAQHRRKMHRLRPSPPACPPSLPHSSTRPPSPLHAPYAPLLSPQRLSTEGPVVV